jgi:hypothetical protein
MILRFRISNNNSFFAADCIRASADTDVFAASSTTGWNVSISSGNNNNNTAEASTSIQENLPQQQSAISPILLPQQMPQSQQQQGQQQRNQAVSIVPGSSTLAENTFKPNPVQVSIGATVTYLSNILDYESY